MEIIRKTLFALAALFFLVMAIGVVLYMPSEAKSWPVVKFCAHLFWALSSATLFVLFGAVVLGDNKRK